MSPNWWKSWKGFRRERFNLQSGVYDKVPWRLLQYWHSLRSANIASFHTPWKLRHLFYLRDDCRQRRETWKKFTMIGCHNTSESSTTCSWCLRNMLLSRKQFSSWSPKISLQEYLPHYMRRGDSLRRFVVELSAQKIASSRRLSMA